MRFRGTAVPEGEARAARSAGVLTFRNMRIPVEVAAGLRRNSQEAVAGVEAG
jgi:ABC-type arginine/histidine transport system permease subunit